LKSKYHFGGVGDPLENIDKALGKLKGLIAYITTECCVRLETLTTGTSSALPSLKFLHRRILTLVKNCCIFKFKEVKISNRL